MTITNTVSVSEARANFTKIGRQVSETRKPVTVFKGSTPYLVISPAPIAEAPNAETLEAFSACKPHESEGELFAALGL